MAQYIYGEPKQWVCFNSGIYGVDLFEKEHAIRIVNNDNVNNISEVRRVTVIHP